MPNERRYSNELNLESVGINLPYNMQAEQSVLGAVLILVSDPLQALGFVALFLFLQQIEGNLIYPHVMGNAIGLPSIWVLAAVSIGGSLMGVVGMLIFIPIVSVAYACSGKLCI